MYPCQQTVTTVYYRGSKDIWGFCPPYCFWVYIGSCSSLSSFSLYIHLYIDISSYDTRHRLTSHVPNYRRHPHLPIVNLLYSVSKCLRYYEVYLSHPLVFTLSVDPVLSYMYPYFIVSFLGLY